MIIMRNIKCCEECKSTNVLITSDLNGNIFSAVCLTCGWEFASQTFKKLTATLDDNIKDFEREEYLKTKRGI
jgi:ribosomal protein L37AE/L43A